MTARQVTSGTAYSMRHKIVQAIHSPLGFFALALLIVEFFLFGAGVWFDLENAQGGRKAAIVLVYFFRSTPQ